MNNTSNFMCQYSTTK